MPFDNTNFTERYSPKPAPFLYEPFVPGPEGARRLARALRRQMPDGFTWNFEVAEEDSDCCTAGCAMGLAKVLGYLNCCYPNTYSMSKAFGMPVSVAQELFLNNYIYGVEMMRDVTPTMVADAIDKWLVSIGEKSSTDV